LRPKALIFTMASPGWATGFGTVFMKRALAGPLPPLMSVLGSVFYEEMSIEVRYRMSITGKFGVIEHFVSKITLQ
jgi:hypothetical protein